MGAPTQGDRSPHGSVLVRFTLRSLAANRVRTAVTVAGIALATGLLMAVLASVTSLQNGLANQSRETGGVWQVEFPATDDAELARLREAAGSRLDRLAVQRDLGAATFSSADSGRTGTYLSVLTLPDEQGGTARRRGDDAYEVVPTPAVAQGRLPEKDGEIALTDNLRGVELTAGPSELPGVDALVRAEGPLELGSEVTLELGRRVAHPEGAQAYEVGAESSVMCGSVVTATYADGSVDVEQGAIAETLEGVAPARTYTVVGFVEPDWSIPGYVAYASPDAEGSLLPRTNAYFSTSCGSHDELSALVETLRPAAGERTVVLNGGLLAYEGLAGDRLAFDTIALFAATLAVVIAIAAACLISNAFTISVSERTRQFGLLSSLGASRRQLRRTVLVEAVVLGAVGIPIGIGLGLLGAAVAFAITGDGWARMVGTDAAVTLVVRPWCVGLTVALAVATLLVSAAVPAMRAGSVSAVDAIRMAADVRPGRRLRRALSGRRSAADSLSADGRRPRGLVARVGGMPAFLARRSLVVSASKARVAALSLAVSVTLLVTAGVVNDMLTGAADATSIGAATSFDLELVTGDSEGAGGDRSVALDTAGDLLARVAALDGVEGAAACARLAPLVSLSDALLPRAPIGSEGTPGAASGGVDGAGRAVASVLLVDDATWRALAPGGAASGDADPGTLSALLVGTVSTSDGVRYGTDEAVAAGTSGTVDLLALERREGYGDPIVSLEDGKAFYVPEDEGDAPGALAAPLDDVTSVAASVPTSVVSADLGERSPVGPSELMARFPTLVMPASAVLASDAALGALLQGASAPQVSLLARLAEGADDGEVLREMEDAASQVGGIDVLGTSNLAATLRDARAMAFTVQVFLYCFAAILALIAVANVFNTIASGMVLRTREFAVLRSAGMGERAFRRMILTECADYALRGLALGTLLSLLVELFLWKAMSVSVSGLSFVVPWGHLALAFVVVVAVLAASVAYALRKTHATSLVEALRSEAL